MLTEFRDFIARGNVLDLAVAVIIGAAFGTIASSLTGDVIMPVVGAIFGGLDFSSHFVVLGQIPADYAGSLTDYAALKKAGIPAGPINTISQALSDVQAQHRAMVRTIAGVQVVGSPVRMDGARADSDLPPPALGEHTAEVLGDLVNADELERLRASGVIG